MHRDVVSAAVLAGGMSKRMGVDKATLRIVDNGPTMIDLVVQALERVSDDVLIIGTGRRDLAELFRGRARVIPDAYPGTGPLGGIATAVAAARCSRCVVVACDLPFLNAEVLGSMIAADPAADVTIPTLAGTSRQGGTTVHQTLHALYSKSALPMMERALREGRNQVIGWFPEVRVHSMSETDVRAVDPNLLSFFNVNTKEALSTVREGLANGSFSLTDEPPGVVTEERRQ